MLVGTTEAHAAQTGARPPAIERDISFAQDDPRQVLHVYGFDRSALPGHSRPVP
jgi:hypothetical protein